MSGVCLTVFGTKLVLNKNYRAKILAQVSVQAPKFDSFFHAC
jgi:hypothetical protein